MHAVPRATALGLSRAGLSSRLDLRLAQNSVVPQAVQAPVFTPFVCWRHHNSTSLWRAPCLRSAGQFSHQAHHPAFASGHDTRASLVCRGSSSASAVSIQSASSSPNVPDQAQQLLRACKNAFICMAICTVWGWITTICSTGSALPLASMTLAAAPETNATTAVKSAWTGLAAGVLHTLCGPDHLAALTPLTIGRNRVIASFMGALWGFGHSTGQLILGLVMVLLKDRFHDFLPALEKWSGLVVAATLVAIGCMGIYESYFEKEADSEHHAEEEQHAMKLALAGGDGAQVGAVRGSMKASFATYATGIVYGLQPDALFVVVPALALPTKAAAFAYCTMFVIGTVLAMGGYTLLIGTTSAALTKERPWLQAHLSTIASGIAICVGLLIGLSGLGIEVPVVGHIFGH